MKVYAYQRTAASRNDQTREQDGYGVAIATAFKTPEAGDVFSSKYLLSELQKLYNQLVTLKQQRSAELAQPETLENISITSERMTQIQRRVSTLDSFPLGLDRVTVRNTFKKLNAWKEIKGVQKLLREYTDGDKAKVDQLTGFQNPCTVCLPVLSNPENRLRKP